MPKITCPCCDEELMPVDRLASIHETMLSFSDAFYKHQLSVMDVQQTIEHILLMSDMAQTNPTVN